MVTWRTRDFALHATGSHCKAVNWAMTSSTVFPLDQLLPCGEQTLGESGSSWQIWEGAAAVFQAKETWFTWSKTVETANNVWIYVYFKGRAKRSERIGWGVLVERDSGLRIFSLSNEKVDLPLIDMRKVSCLASWRGVCVGGKSRGSDSDIPSLRWLLDSQPLISFWPSQNSSSSKNENTLRVEFCFLHCCFSRILDNV